MNGHLSPPVKDSVGRYGKLSIVLKNLGLSLITFLWRGNDSEQKKIIIDKSRKRAFLRCWIHIPPIMASISLAGLNLGGLFVGETFSGSNTLGLQILAKIMELLIVASLGTTILDLVRNETMFFSEGLPFGLLGSAISFNNLSWFWSPQFWYSIRAVRTKRRKFAFFTYLSISGLIAAVSGPSSALLMLPSLKENWPAGGTSFWLVGDKSTLWPSQLDRSHIGGETCIDATPDLLAQGKLNNSGCIWYSTAAVAQSIRDWHFNSGNQRITLTDGAYTRSVAYRSSNLHFADTWVYSSNAAVGVISNRLSETWRTAVDQAPIALRTIAYKFLKYRVASSGVARIASLIPMVRSRCYFHGNYGEFEPITYYANTTSLQFPILPDFAEGPEWRYVYPYNLTRVNKTSTSWVPIPRGESLTSNGSTISYYPSAFSIIQIPYPKDERRCLIWACSIDARWAEGHNIATNVADTIADDFIQQGEISDIVSRGWINDFPSLSKETSTKIKISMDWLYALTPIFNVTNTYQARDRPAWTSLASLMSSVGLDNSTAMVGGWRDLRPLMEAPLALLVVEGLARIGLTNNGGLITQYGEARTKIKPAISDEHGFDELLRNGNALSPPDGFQPSQMTKLHWSMTVSGSAYRADSSGYFLALTVLFIYLVMAFGHLGYAVAANRSSEAYKSFEDMMLLSHGSQPAPDLLKNTSAGIRSRKTLQTPVRIRVRNGNDLVKGNEEVQLIFGSALDAGSQKVEREMFYGAL